MTDALVNLLSNAHKYGGSPPVVALRAAAAAAATAGRGEVAISVTDNGEGIAKPEHRRIFEKFYRVDDRLSRSRQGSGLGLAIVNHVARAHRARVTVDSTQGKGSTFTILLPAAPSSAADPKAASVAGDVPPPSSPAQEERASARRRRAVAEGEARGEVTRDSQGGPARGARGGAEPHET
jgi:two-component system phosphate regulon sensor histidine kinase PhoR